MQTLWRQNAFDGMESNNESEIQCDLSNTNEIWESKIVDVTSIDFQDENSNTDLTAQACRNENIRENKKNESSKESNVFDCEDHWLDHIRQHILNTQLQVHDHFLCQDCNQLFETLAAFSVHACPYKQYEKCDNVDDIVEETSDTFPCDTNPNGFQAIVTDNKKYIVPEELESSVKPYICDVCGKGFTQNSGLYTHRRVHTGEKPYACDLCGKKFRLKHDRDNHRRCHTGERPYQCTYCGKAFRTSHDHRQHLLIHTGQRPYRCDYCSKGFRRINGLNVHKRIHTGEKPYGCAICGRHFTQKGDMMKHCKTQHGNTF
ncbi:Testis-specific zinc finger protein topi [Gryllus bimaculatus]|nr:Testis-specific zinc finger protein topi [Gryllus bimaculatus]